MLSPLRRTPIEQKSSIPLPRSIPARKPETRFSPALHRLPLPFDQVQHHAGWMLLLCVSVTLWFQNSVTCFLFRHTVCRRHGANFVIGLLFLLCTLCPSCGYSMTAFCAFCSAHFNRRILLHAGHTVRSTHLAIYSCGERLPATSHKCLFDHAHDPETIQHLTPALPFKRTALYAGFGGSGFLDLLPTPFPIQTAPLSRVSRRSFTTRPHQLQHPIQQPGFPHRLPSSFATNNSSPTISIPFR